ncbi:sialic acid-binding Ig-like lectin 13 [Mauremys reevesii]|uniref:sialic acid-binding Ig-like lectin 13 n=1 Tax=Mauremys reevesii TaxID=260615 RepID=UPI00193FA66F|nr:sialic acid-binding Ig-like lectin 13 [Mauremys reevesii]
MWVPGASQMPPSTKLCIEIILALLCQGGLCQEPVYRIQVPSRVTAQQGLCVLLPCHFTANFESSGAPYKYWFKDDDRDTGLAVATTDPGRALRVPGGRIRLVGDAPDDCSLHISDVRAGDRDRYLFRFVKGDFKYSYVVTQPLVDVTELTEQPVLGVPEVLLSGQLVNVTCQAPGTCSGTPPQITWTGGFDYIARNISVALANGSVSYSSELSFTPAPGDDGKELVCTVAYPAVVGVFTRRAVRLHVRDPPKLLPWGNCTVQGRGPGGAATCHCVAEGNPPPRLEWRLPNRTLPGDFEGPELRATSWAQGPAVSGELRGPAWALANVSCAATNAHGQSQAALPVVPAAGFPLILVVASAVGGSLVLVGAGAAVAWRVRKGRQGGRVPARAGRCQGTRDGQVCHAYEQPVSSVPSRRQDVTGGGRALEKKGRGGGGGRCYLGRGDGDQFTEENIYANV